MRRLYSPEEVSEYLGVPVATLYRWRYSKGGPPSIRCGKYLRYDPDELEQWIQSRTQKAS